MHWDMLEYTSLLHLRSSKLYHYQNCRATEQAAAAYLTYWEWKSAKGRVRITYKYSSQIYAMHFPAWWKVENGNAILSWAVSWPSSISPTSPTCPAFSPSSQHVAFGMLVWLRRQSVLFLLVHPLVLKKIYSHDHCPYRPLIFDQTRLLLCSLTG